MQVNGKDMHPEGASQLVLGKWPLLEELEVSFSLLHEQLFQTIIQGDWPTLKKLDIGTSAASGPNNTVHHWSEQQIEAWKAVAEKCRNMCMSTWPGLRVLNLPTRFTFKSVV